jgi:hypothetical protein
MRIASKSVKKEIVDEGVFLRLYIGLLNGLVRTSETRIGLELAGRFFNQQGSLPPEDSVLPKNFDRETFDYVVTASLLVYCVSMFDVFLSDVTRLLLLNNLAALGKNCLVPIEVLASQKARNEIIKKEVEKRVRNIAYSSFQDRLASLSTVFGIKLDLEEKEQLELRRLSELRNKIVHDQSAFLFKLDRQHRPLLHARKDSDKPVAIKERDVRKATTLFVKLGERTVQKVEEKLFGQTHLK